jgi:hypothetical protein
MYQETEPNRAKYDRNNEMPAYAMNGSLMGRFEPLIDDKTKEKEMDKRPNISDPVS